MLQDHSRDEIALAFNKARKRQPALSELLDFSERLVQEQHGVTAEVDPAAFDDTALRGRAARGEPVLPRHEFRIDLDCARGLFRRLCRLAVERVAEAQVAAAEIESAVGLGKLDLADLLRGAAAEVGYAFAVADRLALDLELLYTLAMASIRPSVEAVAKRVGAFVDNIRWLRLVCPVCGAEPGYAELRGQELAASRYLHCGFCGWAWPVRRLACPFCDNKDHDRLQTLIIENHLSCKLEVCDVCRRYVKSVDNKEFIGVIPEVEVLITPHLDLAAMERGYH
jgi:FdhE protein